MEFPTYLLKTKDWISRVELGGQWVTQKDQQTWLILKMALIPSKENKI